MFPRLLVPHARDREATSDREPGLACGGGDDRLGERLARRLPRLVRTLRRRASRGGRLVRRRAGRVAAAWSPDRTRILFTRIVPHANGERGIVTLMRVDGTEVRALTHGVADEYATSWQAVR